MHVFCCRALCIITISKLPPMHCSSVYLYGNQEPNTAIPRSKNLWKMVYLGPKTPPSCGALAERRIWCGQWSIEESWAYMGSEMEKHRCLKKPLPGLLHRLPSIKHVQQGSTPIFSLTKVSSDELLLPLTNYSGVPCSFSE